MLLHTHAVPCTAHLSCMVAHLHTVTVLHVHVQYEVTVLMVASHWSIMHVIELLVKRVKDLYVYDTVRDIDRASWFALYTGCMCRMDSMRWTMHARPGAQGLSKVCSLSACATQQTNTSHNNTSHHIASSKHQSVSVAPARRLCSNRDTRCSTSDHSRSSRELACILQWMPACMHAWVGE